MSQQQNIEFNLGCGTLIGLFLIVALAANVIKDVPMVGRWWGHREDPDVRQKLENLERRVRDLEKKLDAEQ